MTLGKAFPHLLTAVYGTAWREPMLLASGLAIAGGVLVLLVVRDGPYVTATSRFDPHAIRRICQSRGARLATLGYLGHMWELYAMWTWIAVLAAASFAASGSRHGDGRWIGRRRFLRLGAAQRGASSRDGWPTASGAHAIAIWALWISAACAALTPVVFGAAPIWFFALAMVWGFAVVADSAQFSALVSEHSPADYVGTALTLQTCLGFLLTIVTIELMPRARGRSRLALGLAAAGARPAAGHCRDARVGGTTEPRRTRKHEELSSIVTFVTSWLVLLTANS